MSCVPRVSIQSSEGLAGLGRKLIGLGSDGAQTGVQRSDLGKMNGQRKTKK